MKLGLFGGSFDPPHRGHLEPVRMARQRFALDRVVYLPTAQPPHKPGPRLASALARYTMVELALLAEQELFASPYELTLGRAAYTADSLAHFRGQYPDAELSLLVGADSFATLHTWRRWREIARGIRLVVLARPGWEAERLRREVPPEVWGLVESGQASLMSGPAIDLSSTLLREVLGRGDEPPAGALSPLVLEYVRKYSLYR